MKLNIIRSISLKTSSGGSGRTVNTWTRIGKANVLTTVTFPIIDKFLNDQSSNNFLSFLILSVKLISKKFCLFNSYI